MKDFKKYYLVPAEPDIVYKAMTFKPTIELWTGASAVFEKKPGTEFSMWDDSISGKNLEFEDGKKIVQEWYFGKQEKPSIVTLKFHPDKKGTSLEVAHSNIPEEAYPEIKDGWTQVFMKDLIDFFRD